MNIEQVVNFLESSVLIEAQRITISPEMATRITLALRAQQEREYAAVEPQKGE